MCGIAGFIRSSASADHDSLSQIAGLMANHLAHRGPDGSGVWADPAAGVALGHRRLSIIDLSETGKQPMISANGRYVLIYNGCVYNFKELRNELQASGSRFRGGSDTEVVVEAIAAWGLERAVQRFVGMFAFALWDGAKRRLYLVRDRFGVKPLYYGWLGSTFAFSSELRGLEVHPDFKPEIDKEAVALYVARSCVPAPWSIYRGIKKLPPGMIVAFDQRRREAGDPVPYWALRDVVEAGVRDPFVGDAEEASRELEALLKDSVQCRLVADVPVGAFLSGGIDSSLVTALMQQASSQTVKTFTIGFSEGDYNEADEARAVARHLGTEHHEFYVSSRDFRSLIPHLPNIFDEPFADSSQIPSYLIAKLARANVAVTLSGDGGDEMLGGYDRYVWTHWIQAHTRQIPDWAKRVVAKGLLQFESREWDRFFSSLPAFVRPRNPGKKLHKLAAVLASTEVVHTYSQLVRHWPVEVSPLADGHEPSTVLTDVAQWPRVSGFIDQMMYLDAITYLSDDILTKVDRASMAVGLEVRTPYLDHRVAAFAWRLPNSHKIAGRRGKLLLRRILHKYLPHSLIERPKRGFSIPLNQWLREPPLRDWVEALIEKERLRDEGFFEPTLVRSAWDDHLSGRHDRQSELWDVLMFQAWLDLKRGRIGTATVPSAAPPDLRLVPANEAPRRNGKTKVAFLIYSLQTGGAEMQMSLLARHLDPTRFSPVVITLHEGGSLAPVFDDTSVPVFSAAKQRLWDITGFLSRLRAIVQQVNPHVIYSFTDYPNVLNQLLHASGGHHRTVWGLRASDNRPETQDRIWRMIFAASRLLCRGADALVSNSNAGRIYYEGIGYPKKRIDLVLNGIDTEMFKPNPTARAKLRAAWGVDNKVVIGFVSRLHPKKDPWSFVQAALAVAQANPVAHFLVAGDDNSDYGRAVKAEAQILIDQRRLTWAGARRDVPDVMNALDIFSLASAYGEGFPNVLGEAMATGLPAVTTDVGDAAEVLGDPRWVVPAGRVTDFVWLWSTLLAMPPQERDALGKRNRQRVLQLYTLDRMIRRSEDLIERLMERKPALERVS